MDRYICVFYDTTDKSNINKTNKIVKVFECNSGSDAKFKIFTDYKTTLIKSIRNIENPVYWLHDKELRSIEDKNNFRL